MSSCLDPNPFRTLGAFFGISVFIYGDNHNTAIDLANILSNYNELDFGAAEDSVSYVNKALPVHFYVKPLSDLCEIREGDIVLMVLSSTLLKKYLRTALACLNTGITLFIIVDQTSDIGMSGWLQSALVSSVAKLRLTWHTARSGHIRLFRIPLNSMSRNTVINFEADDGYVPARLDDCANKKLLHGCAKFLRSFAATVNSMLFQLMVTQHWRACASTRPRTYRLWTSQHAERIHHTYGC